MDVTLSQPFIFAVFTLVGIALGLFYTVTHRSSNKVFVVIADVLYGVTSLIAVFYLNLAINCGKFSLYCFFALGLGLFIYCKTCLTSIDKVLKWLYNKATNFKEKGNDNISK
ncbi:MAG: spore cortex biosynthesis protein YabQ [Clostridia bacterium]